MKLADVVQDKAAVIRELARGAQRFHHGSIQDRHPFVAALHNAYAVALIDALWSISDEAEVFAVAKISLKKLRLEIKMVQDKLEGKAIEIMELLQRKGIKIPGL